MWSAKGYSGFGCAELIDSLSGRPAIVAGGAKGVFEEVAAAESSLDRPVVFAANDVGLYLSHVDHFVSLHTPRLVHWVALRRDENGTGYGNKDFQVHDAGLYGHADWHQWTLSPIMSLSGLFAAQIAFLMGCRPIILCGCPMDETSRFWESTPYHWAGSIHREQDRAMLLSEVRRNPDFDRALFSMSGWTKNALGGLEDIAA